MSTEAYERAPEAQEQARQPGVMHEMHPQPATSGDGRPHAHRLGGKVALVSGGDSGIGRAVALAFAHEGADVAILYLDEHDDANETVAMIEALGRQSLALPGDIGDEAFCREAVQHTVEKFERLDILVNNAGEQHTQQTIEDIDAAQLERTFRTNIFGMFFLTKAALKHLGEGATIINTASITAYEGNPALIDYSATKGAIVSFTRSLSQSLVKRGIRVNAVAPGPIWTPLIPASYPAEKVSEFGKDTPMGRPGQPEEVAPAYVFLASQESSYMSGQTLHVNGGQIVNG